MSNNPHPRIRTDTRAKIHAKTYTIKTLSSKTYFFRRRITTPFYTMWWFVMILIVLYCKQHPVHLFVSSLSLFAHHHDFWFLTRQMKIYIYCNYRLVSCYAPTYIIILNTNNRHRFIRFRIQIVC